MGKARRTSGTHPFWGRPVNSRSTEKNRRVLSPSDAEIFLLTHSYQVLPNEHAGPRNSFLKQRTRKSKLRKCLPSENCRQALSDNQKMMKLDDYMTTGNKVFLTRIHV